MNESNLDEYNLLTPSGIKTIGIAIMEVELVAGCFINQRPVCRGKFLHTGDFLSFMDPSVPHAAQLIFPGSNLGCHIPNALV